MDGTIQKLSSQYPQVPTRWLPKAADGSELGNGIGHVLTLKTLALARQAGKGQIQIEDVGYKKPGSLGHIFIERPEAKKIVPNSPIFLLLPASATRFSYAILFAILQ